LREIDKRIRFLTKRLEIAVVSDPSVHFGSEQIYFGATVTYEEESGLQRTITILGIDEADNLQHQVSWVSPIARALLRTQLGDVIKLTSPSGSQEIEVIRVEYPKATLK
jgi:transcription elongation factor GreB